MLGTPMYEIHSNYKIRCFGLRKPIIEYVVHRIVYKEMIVGSTYMFPEGELVSVPTHEIKAKFNNLNDAQEFLKLLKSGEIK